MLFKMWIVSALVGTLGAWFMGLHPLSPYLYEGIIHLSLVFLAGLLILVFGWTRSWIMVLLVAGALPLAMAYSQAVASREVNPSNTFTRYTENVPASVSTWTQYGAIWGRVTNHHPRDWMRLATVTCTPAFANGDLSRTSQEFSVSEGGWLAPGEHADRRLLDSKGNNWAPGMVLYLSPCRVSSAEFYQAPMVKPTFTYAREDINYHYVFTVTNTRQDASLTRVSFSCWVQNDAQGSTPHKQDLRMSPLYGDGNSYIAKPGETVVLYNTDSFAGRTLSDCAVRDVVWTH
jgi:hypothetical protein